jgi:microcystin-dependent protein
MSEPFLAEIKIVGFDFPPRNYALCNGQLLPLSQNQALFSLLGTTYGGDGRVNFALPNLRGRAPVHEGPDFRLGQSGGEENHTLALTEMPGHQHTVQAASGNGSSPIPTGNVLASANNVYGPVRDMTSLVTGTVSNAGSSQAHTNMQPWLALNFCIALQGIFPS